MIILFGIPNCDTVKKARQWLDNHAVEYRFHDFRKDGLDLQTLQQWVSAVGWEALLNRRGTTWRQLPAETRDAIEQDSAVVLMLGQPTLIKRPVLDVDGALHVGFKDTDYARLFSVTQQ